MKIAKSYIIKIILCAFVIANCTNNNISEAEKLFFEMYKHCEMNTLLKMEFSGKFEGDNNINFDVVPTSNISVILPSGSNIKLLSFDNNHSKWIEIKNNVQYFPVDGKYIIGKNDRDKEYEYTILGVIPNLYQKTNVRMVIHGHIYENGVETDKCVGAFVDFEFIP